MKEQDNEKCCTNCRYYLAHYIKRDISYFNIHSGHCINNNYRDSRKKRELKLCEFWEDIATRKEERKRAIKETLIDMSKRLDEIAMLLKDDYEVDKKDT